MSSSSLGWSISIIKPAIDRCRSLCSDNNRNGALPFTELIQQLDDLESASHGPEDLPPVKKIYVNLEAIAQTLEQCQVFLSQYRTRPLQQLTRADFERNADLTKRLNLHTQTLEVYYALLTPPSSLERRATLPTPNTPPVNSTPSDSEPLSAELNQVKRLRRLLLDERAHDFLGSHQGAAKLLDAELATIVGAIESQITRSQNWARLGGGLHNNHQIQDIVEHEAPGRPPSIQTQADSIIYRAGSISSATGSSIVASLTGTTASSIHNAAKPLGYEEILDVKISFRIADNEQQDPVPCTLKATYLKDSRMTIAAITGNDDKPNLKLPILNFGSSSNRPIPSMRWRGNRTKAGGYDFVVTLSSTHCVLAQKSIKDLEYRFTNEQACKRFHEIVYGRTLGVFVNLRKLHRKEGSNKTRLCGSSVIYFWQKRSSSKKLELADYTMLYFTDHPANLPMWEPIHEYEVPDPTTWKKGEALLCQKGGKNRLVFEFSPENGQKDLDKLCKFFSECRLTACGWDLRN